MLLSGRNAVVTGGSRGIGYEICKILLEHGVRTLAVSRDLSKLTQANHELPRLSTLRADVSISEDVDHVAEWVQDRWGKLDILVNNAGVFTDSDKELTARSDELFFNTIRVNLFGPYLCTKRLIPYLLKSEDPRIVNVGSTLGIVSNSLKGAYGVSKAALHALTIATANELRGTVAVNALSPGYVRTDMSPGAPTHPRTSAEALLWLLAKHRDTSGELFQGKRKVRWWSQ